MVAIVVSRPPKLTFSDSGIALRQGKQTFRRHLTRAPYRRDHAGAIVGDILFSDVDAVPAGVLGAVEGCIRARDQTIDGRNRLVRNRGPKLTVAPIAFESTVAPAAPKPERTRLAI